MAEPLIPQPATDAAGFLPGPLGLRLDEAFMPLTALRAAPQVLDKLVPLGQIRHGESGITMRFSPGVAWHSGALPTGRWRPLDISHGLTHLRLRGVEALHFVALYTTADLHGPALRQVRVVRTKLNQYTCAIWWENTRDIHILTDRSMAQSLCDHLRVLSLRHAPADPTLTPHPVAPGAPDRRG